MLEDTVEEMSTTFVGLSDSVLQSHHIRSQPYLITSIGDSVKRALELAVNATRGPDDEPEAVDDDQESSPDGPGALAQPEEARAVSAASSQGKTPTTVTFVTTNEMRMPDFHTTVSPQMKTLSSIKAIIQQRQSVPQNVRRMLTQNTFFTKEFWGGDYNTTADMYMVERPNRPLPFWERLLRVNLTTVIHRLTNDGMRGDTNFCVRWGARSFRYSLQHKSKADLLAGTRWVIDTIVAMDARVDSMDRGISGPRRTQHDWRPDIETYFDNHDLRISGAATMHSMVLAGVPVETLINAHEVERYLEEKGMVEVNENEMEMKWTIAVPSPRAVEMETKHAINDERRRLTIGDAPRSRRSQPLFRRRSSLSRHRRPQMKTVTVSIDSLIAELMEHSVCTGNGICYPKALVNSAIVASVVRIGN